MYACVLVCGYDRVCYNVCVRSVYKCIGCIVCR